MWTEITANVFIKKNKKGNILKILREHYLHADIGCGFVNCGKCKFKESPSILTDEKSTSEAIMQPHLIILDVYVAFNQIDLLEDTVIKNVIICRTGLDEARNRSPALYKRLLNIIKDKPRKFYLFPNDYYTETYVERWPEETKILYHERLIRKAATWYQKHLEKKIKVFLVTDDAESLMLAEAEGLNVIRAQNYFTSIKDPPHFEERYLLKRSFSKINDQKKTYSKHLTSSEIQRGLQSRKYFKGVYYPSRENSREGTVNIISPDFPFDSQQLLVQGQNNINRAIDGDTVAVEVFPESLWAIVTETMPDAESDQDENLEEIIVETKKEKIALPCGRVVGITERKLKQYCGILEAPVIESSNRLLFVPANRKIPKIRVRTSKFDELKNQRIVAVIDHWPTNSRFPEGHIVRILGNIGDRDTENEVLLIENDVPHSEFSKNVLDCLPKLPWIITDEDVKKRTDLRHVDVCSVDPPGCTDIDDALHCSRMDNGNYEVGVHIADVSHFIRPGTAIDKEAANRASTVYLVDKRIDMVPELLSSNLCSLRGNEERFAMSCIWELTPNAEIVNTHFCKSIILSKSAMTYQDAQTIIDDLEQQHNLAQSLRSLNLLAKILKQRRIDNGALLLASTEVRFNLNCETNDPIEPVTKKLMDTNSMVEEFMILANISAGTKILEEFPECAMLRRHPPPSTQQIDELVNVGNRLGFELNVKSNKELGQSLEKANKPENQYFNTMLKIVVTRCMNQALYFPSGMLKMKDYYHYGLALPIYTHFTSPIRRYADIIVHRLLAVCIEAEVTYPDLLDKKKSQDLCNNLNYRNRMARQAGRASVNLYTHIFLRDKVLEEEGYILFVRKNFLQVYIPKYGLDGSLYLTDKKDSINVPFTFSASDLTQTWGDITFRMFDRVKVQLSLDRTNLQHEKLIIKLVKPEIPSFSVPSIEHMEF